MWGKGIVEATFDATNTLFCQHVAGYTGSNAQLRGDRVNAEAAWTVPDLQDLLDEWLLVWQQRSGPGTTRRGSTTTPGCRW
jgi:putative transposase